MWLPPLFRIDILHHQLVQSLWSICPHCSISYTFFCHYESSCSLACSCLRLSQLASIARLCLPRSPRSLESGGGCLANPCFLLIGAGGHPSEPLIYYQRGLGASVRPVSDLEIAARTCGGQTLPLFPCGFLFRPSCLPISPK